MDTDLERLMAILGTGVALAALIMSQVYGLRREMGDQRRDISDLRDEVHHQMGAVRERIARMEGVLDMIKGWYAVAAANTRSRQPRRRFFLIHSGHVGQCFERPPE